MKPPPAEIDRMSRSSATPSGRARSGSKDDRSPFYLGDERVAHVPSAVATQAEAEGNLGRIGELGQVLPPSLRARITAGSTTCNHNVGRPVTWSAILAYDESRDVEGLRGPASSPTTTAICKAEPTCTRRSRTGRSRSRCRWPELDGPCAGPVLRRGVHRRRLAGAEQRSTRQQHWRDDCSSRGRLRGAAWNRVRWDRFTVAESASPGDRAGDAEWPTRRAHPFDVLLDLAVADGLATRFQVVAANGNRRPSASCSPSPAACWASRTRAPT